MKPMAPHGEWLRQRILAGKKEIVIIFLGKTAEHKANALLTHLPYTMYLPLKTSPYAYAWPVDGCEVHLTDTNESSLSFLKTFVMCLFINGATLIHYLSKKHQQLFERS